MQNALQQNKQIIAAHFISETTLATQSFILKLQTLNGNIGKERWGMSRMCSK